METLRRRQRSGRYTYRLQLKGALIMGVSEIWIISRDAAKETFADIGQSVLRVEIGSKELGDSREDTGEGIHYLQGDRD